MPSVSPEYSSDEHDIVQPTRTLPLLSERRGRHAASSPPWLTWVLVAGSVLVLGMCGVAGMKVFGGSADRPADTAVAAPSEMDTMLPSEPVVTEEPSPSPSVRAASAAALISALPATVTKLVRDGQLDKNGGKELRRRAEEAAFALAEGDVQKARTKLSEFGEKVVNLRKEGRMTERGYQTIVSALNAIAQVLPQG